MIQDNDVQGSDNRPSRRIWLTNLVVLGLGSALWRSSRTDAAGLIAIDEESAQGFMMKAFEMKREAVAAGDQAYGAVVVKDDRIVSAASSRVVTNVDPTAHAEMGGSSRCRSASWEPRSERLRALFVIAALPDVRSGSVLGAYRHLYFGDPIRDGGTPSLRRC